MTNPSVELVEVIRTASQPKVRCKCRICGNEFVMWRSHYYRGSTACKCKGVTNNRIHSIYTNIKSRCYNPNASSYKSYGGRGITLCDEWKNDYSTFEKWALHNGYSDGLTIERIDVDGNYTPSNCTWVTAEDQQRNKRTTRRIDNTSLRNYCNSKGINYKTVHTYLSRHPTVPLERIVSRYLGGTKHE